MKQGILVASVFIVLSASPVWGCECKVSAGIEEDYTRAAYVFEGRVIAVNGLEMDVEVGRVYKGAILSSIVRFVVKNKCSLSLELGKDYLLYADRDGNTLIAHRCNRTRLLSELRHDVTALGQVWPDEIAAIKALKEQGY